MISSLRRLLPVLLFLPIAAHGTIVTTHIDEDDGSLGGGAGISLREAVTHSAAGTTITFDSTLSGQTIRLTSGQIVISKTLTIDGSALPAKITLSGDKTGDGKSADDSEVLWIISGTVTIDSLIISGGSGDFGGGLAILFSGICNLKRSIVAGNKVENVGGGIFNRGTLTIQKCEISGNSAGWAGAIANHSIFGSLLIEDSTISGNSALENAGGIWNSLGIVTVRNSSLTNNSTSLSSGGGIDNDETFTIENSTIQGNSAKLSGGGINNSWQLNLKNTTVTGNTSDTAGGGIYQETGSIYQETGSIVLNNSIIAGNLAPGTPEISGTFTGSNNLTSGAPLLAPLGDYGGPTHTMPPLPGSPVIDAGGTTTPTTDQRGFARVSTPDIGAAEYQETADLARFWKLDFDGDGSPYGVEQALGTDPLVSDAGNPRNLTGPIFDFSGHARLQIGLDSQAATETRWVISRSPSLSPGSFMEIYRFDGSASIAAPGIDFTLAPGRSISVTDENPPPGGAFYRFEAVLEP